MAKEGREILARSNLNITSAETLKQAGELAVAAVKGA
jgi:succinyl-CoA synthetase beta subunit